MSEKSLFWEDLARDLEDPTFKREYLLQSLRIRTVDEIVNALDAARVSAQLSKADLARAINAEPAVVRRLFSAHGNPTLGRLTEIAAALGLKVALEPLEEPEADLVTGSLLIEVKRPGRPSKVPAKKAAAPKVKQPRRKKVAPVKVRRVAPAAPKTTPARLAAPAARRQEVDA